MLGLALGDKAVGHLTGKLKESVNETVIFLLGARAGAQDVEAVSRLGAWDLIVKPFRSEELKTCLTQAVEVFELRQRASGAAVARMTGTQKRRPRMIEEQVRIPDLSELVPDDEALNSRQGRSEVRERVIKDVPDSVVEESYRRRQHAMTAEGDIIEQIRRLGELCKSGILTEKEFNEKKKELLSRI